MDDCKHVWKRDYSIPVMDVLPPQHTERCMKCRETRLQDG